MFTHVMPDAAGRVMDAAAAAGGRRKWTDTRPKQVKGDSHYTDKDKDESLNSDVEAPFWICLQDLSWHVLQNNF